MVGMHAAFCSGTHSTPLSLCFFENHPNYTLYLGVFFENYPFARCFSGVFFQIPPSRVVFREISQKTMFLSHFLR